MNIPTKVGQIKMDFSNCGKLLSAIGDETRQAILLTLMEADCAGIRVGEITERTHLSRPAVSHHVKILLDAGIIGVEEQGTKNFYYINLGKEFKKLVDLINHIDELRAMAGGNCYE